MHAGLLELPESEAAKLGVIVLVVVLGGVVAIACVQGCLCDRRVVRKERAIGQDSEMTYCSRTSMYLGDEEHSCPQRRGE
jgi:hypothetical protein